MDLVNQINQINLSVRKKLIPVVVRSLFTVRRCHISCQSLYRVCQKQW